MRARLLLSACTRALPAAAPRHAYHLTRRRLLSTSLRTANDATPTAFVERALPLSPAQRATIFALASAPGRAGVAVIRVSGPATRAVYAAMVRAPSAPTPAPWRVRRCTVVHPLSGEALDDGLCAFFPGPRSFTGEDVLELHTHGGRAVPAAVLRALAALPGTRPADAGEFARRAFGAGRMSLAQAEALADLVDADTDAQRRAARAGASGATTKVYDALRADIIRCLAMVEALIDFGEGEDLEDGVFADARVLAQGVRDAIGAHLADGRRGEIVRAGISLALFGPPNAGKSSLLNHLGPPPPSWARARG
jgi:tRNA modification GTPase